MNTTTAAAQANVTVATIRTWCRIGAIAAVKTAGRWVIDAASLSRRITIGARRAERKAAKAVFSVQTMTAIGGNEWIRIDRSPAMPTNETLTHFTAWLTTDITCLDQGCADITVLKDDLRGEPDDPRAWFSTGDPLHYAVTTVSAADGDHDDAIAEGEDLLAAAGWRITGKWEAVPTGYTVTVERDA